MHNKVTHAITFFALWLIGWPVFAVDKWAAIDGDTVVWGNKTIRIIGIDSPEMAQTCENGKRKWQCGEKAARQMERLINNHELVCETFGKDRYGRLLGDCFALLPDGRLNLGEAMVATGWALAYRHYSQRYVMQENMARLTKTGLWGTTMQKPWEWRRLQGK